MPAGQVLSEGAQGTVAADGTCTITFAPPSLGWVNTGTISVIDSPAATSWMVNMGGLPVLTALGQNPVTLQARTGEVVALSATGLAAGTTYHAVWRGATTDAGTTPYQAPVGVSSTPGIAAAVPTFIAATANNSTVLLVDAAPAGQTLIVYSAWLSVYTASSTAGSCGVTLFGSYLILGMPSNQIGSLATSWALGLTIPAGKALYLAGSYTGLAMEGGVSYLYQ